MREYNSKGFAGYDKLLFREGCVERERERGEREREREWFKGSWLHPPKS
jgi:hypothetical protein